MKPLRFILAFTALLVFFCLLVSCAAGGKVTVPEAAQTSASKERSSVGELNTPRFRELPPEARDYLETLAKAFREKDRAFLVSQGEAQYEKELRFTLDEEIYLALLYRIGPYSKDTHWQSAGASPPRLDTSKVRSIEYTEWEERGPMLEIKGRLYVQNSPPIPCTLILVWRLPEPKILGERP